MCGLLVGWFFGGRCAARACIAGGGLGLFLSGIPRVEIFGAFPSFGVSAFLVGSFRKAL